MAPPPPWTPTPRVSWLIKPARDTTLPSLDNPNGGWERFWVCRPIAHSDNIQNHPFYRIYGYYPTNKDSYFSASLQESAALEVWRACIRKCLVVYHAENIDPDGPLAQDIIEELSAPQQFESLGVCYNTDNLMRVERPHRFSTLGEFRARSFLRLMGAILEQHGHFVTSQCIRRLIQGSVDELVELRLAEHPEQRSRRGKVDWSRLGDVEEGELGNLHCSLSETDDYESAVRLMETNTANAPSAHPRGQIVNLGNLADEARHSMENLTLNSEHADSDSGPSPEAGGAGINNNLTGGLGGGSSGASGNELGIGPADETAAVSSTGPGNESDNGPTVESGAQVDNPSDPMDIDVEATETARQEQPQGYTHDHKIPDRSPWEIMRDLEFSDQRPTLEDTRIPFPGISLSSTLEEYQHSARWPDKTRYFTSPSVSRPIRPLSESTSPHNEASKPNRTAYTQKAVNKWIMDTQTFDTSTLKTWTANTRDTSTQTVETNNVNTGVGIKTVRADHMETEATNQNFEPFSPTHGKVIPPELSGRTGIDYHS
ncbi:hypothetical protein TWF506_005743 [Arthrobotrys conoides]|uniref:Uncharacterized protein n=1 Tax=Arthrobotrys conoides TaxID=74498 RepID=A0AAN8RQ27_9PEZI